MFSPAPVPPPHGWGGGRERGPSLSCPHQPEENQKSKLSPPRLRRGDQREGPPSHQQEENKEKKSPPRLRGGDQGEGPPPRLQKEDQEKDPSHQQKENKEKKSPLRLQRGNQGKGPPHQGPWNTPLNLWKKLKPLAREMRKNPTLAERVLWQHLRRKQLMGYKFRRQHAIGRFIVDFYCHEAALVIEVDGPTHQYTAEEDAIRQEFLEDRGFRVLRFTNEQVLTNLEGVLTNIAEVLQESSKR